MVFDTINESQESPMPLPIISTHAIGFIKTPRPDFLDVHQSDPIEKLTPLQWAISFHDIDGMKRLLQQRADPNAPSARFGWTPLYHCIQATPASHQPDRRLEMMALLLEYGAHTNALNEASYHHHDGRADTPLHAAATQENPIFLQTLLKAHAGPVDLSGIGHETPLHVAVQHNRLIHAQILLEHGANPNQKKPFHITLFSYVNSPEMARLLLNHQADVHLRGHHGLQAIHHSKTIGILNIWLEAGANIHDRDNHGNTLLHFLTDHEIDLAKHLIQLGADVNAVNQEGQTPLHSITDWPFEANPFFETLLLEAGADPFLEDRSGDVPFGERCEAWRNVILQSQHLEEHLTSSDPLSLKPFKRL